MNVNYHITVLCLRVQHSRTRTRRLQMKYYLDTTGHAWSLPLYRSPGLSGSVLCVPAAPYQEDTVCGRSHLFRGAATARFGVKSWCTSLALWEHANTKIKWACTCVDSERMCVCARAYMRVNKRAGLCLMANAVVVSVFVGLFLFYFQKVLVLKNGKHWK